MINKLRKKFVFINMILISIILIFTFGAVYISTSNRLVQESNDTLQKTIEQENEILKKQINIGEQNADSPPPQPQIISFAVQLDTNNNITNVYYNNTDKSDIVTLNTLVNSALANENLKGIIQNENFRFLKYPNEKGMKIAFTDRNLEINTLNSLLKTFILVGIGSLIAFFIVSLYLANWAVKPIKKSWEQQRQFVADASHELKTPLTVILANTDIVLSHKEDTIYNQVKWINYIKAEGERMTTLVNDLLFLAKSDANRNDLVLSKVNFSDIIWNCVLPFESVAFEEEKLIDSKITSDLYINGDNNRLRQLVCIIIDNAIKYSKERGTIKVTLTKIQDKAVLSINNEGEPISKEKIPYIFGRFYRIDESRARKKDGYGLGLAIGKTIADSHNGKITVKSSKAEGTTFSVAFTLAKNN